MSSYPCYYSLLPLMVPSVLFELNSQHCCSCWYIFSKHCMFLSAFLLFFLSFFKETNNIWQNHLKLLFNGNFSVVYLTKLTFKLNNNNKRLYSLLNWQCGTRPRSWVTWLTSSFWKSSVYPVHTETTCRHFQLWKSSILEEEKNCPFSRDLELKLRGKDVFLEM